MADVEPFATADDYRARYGDADEGRLAALLGDATGFLLAAYAAHYGEAWRANVRPLFDAGAKAVCCAMASRVLSAPADLGGASTYQQTAGSYSAMLTFANPTGDMYISKSDLKRLGMGGSRVYAVRPMTDDDRGWER